jgi:hypothetical protein
MRYEIASALGLKNGAGEDPLTILCLVQMYDKRRDLYFEELLAFPLAELSNLKFPTGV